MNEIWLPEDIAKAVDTIKSGGIILYPTDTIWGVGCNATNLDAVKRIYKLKKRPLDKPFVLLVDSIEMLKDHVEKIHPRVETLLQYHERPLTIIYPSARGLPEEILSSDGSVAIRVVNDDYCAQLIREAGMPLVGTSANKAGAPPPKNFGEVSSSIIKGVDYVCKYRQNERDFGAPSVIATYDKRGSLEFIRT